MSSWLRVSLCLSGAVALNAYSFLGMPPAHPDTIRRIVSMLTKINLDIVDPTTTAVFHLYGVMGFVYMSLIAVDGLGQRFRSWPFAVLVTVLGPTIVLLYLAFRRPAPRAEGWEVCRLARFAESRGLAWTLVAFALGSVAYFATGSLASFRHEVVSDYFTHAMVFDLALLAALLPPLLVEDMRRRACFRAGVASLIIMIPIVGAAFYLALRPPLAPSQSEDRT